MTRQPSKDPGALAGAAGAEIEVGNFRTEQYRRRAEWATALVHALEHCDQDDAATICAAYLDRLRTDGPAHPFLNEVRAEAAFWADSAQMPELEAVTLAGLRRLGTMALGLGSRKRILVTLWRSLPADDRARFAARFVLPSPDRAAEPLRRHFHWSRQSHAVEAGVRP